MMAGADFESEYELTGFNKLRRDTSNLYLKATVAEQLDRRRLLDMFHDGIVQKLICIRLKMGLLRDPDSIADEVSQLKELVDSAIENAHILTNEIAPYVLFKVGLGAALYELFRRYAEDCGLCYYINMQNADLDLLDETTNLVVYNLVKGLSVGAVYSCHADMIGINIRTIDSVVEIVAQDNGSFVADFQDIVSTGQAYEQKYLLEATEQVSCLGGSLWVDINVGMRTVCAIIPLKLGLNP